MGIRMRYAWVIGVVLSFLLPSYLSTYLPFLCSTISNFLGSLFLIASSGFAYMLWSLSSSPSTLRGFQYHTGWVACSWQWYGPETALVRFQVPNKNTLPTYSGWWYTHAWKDKESKAYSQLPGGTPTDGTRKKETKNGGSDTQQIGKGIRTAHQLPLTPTPSIYPPPHTTHHITTQQTTITSERKPDISPGLWFHFRLSFLVYTSLLAVTLHYTCVLIIHGC